jgi:fatty acid desaturase
MTALIEHQKLLRDLDYKPFLQKSNLLGFKTLLINYGLIAIAFGLPILWFNPLTFIVSLILLGNRQLGLGVLMHDCVHGAVFNSTKLNIGIGSWLCAAPVLAQFEGYRRYHLKHHSQAGTQQDPDYPNYKIYPVSRRSLMRKFARDLSGITAVKNLYALMVMHSGIIEYDMAYKGSGEKAPLTLIQIFGNLFINLYQAMIFHFILWGLLWLLGYGKFYLLWWLAYFTTFALFSRIRNAAEHASVIDLLDLDPRKHARTVYTSWWEKLTVAPNEVNYHIEHHWMPAIPPYRLKAFHYYIKSQGLLTESAICSGYPSVLRALVHR